MYLAPQNIPCVIVLTLGDKAVLYCIVLYHIVKTTSLLRPLVILRATFQPGGLSSLITVIHIQFTLRYLQQ